MITNTINLNEISRYENHVIPKYKESLKKVPPIKYNPLYRPYQKPNKNSAFSDVTNEHLDIINFDNYYQEVDETLQVGDITSSKEALELGLLEEEFRLITKKLKRKPTFTELSMFSGMWSEHCSYKNSILLLKDLYTQSDRLLTELGEENAGALQIDDEKAVVFKMESHNHPSAVEPYQGAATGVGGIMRDIFTMGARPLVSLNSLRFGSLERPKNCYYLREVVKGIGDYGNSLGIPCAAGEVYFHDAFSSNPLVNAMVVGVTDIKNLASATSADDNCLVLYVGAKTGRDGIHGASFASRNLSEDSVEDRSSVQVGDPFLEKLVMEATLECIEKKLVVAIQDMGAAGLLSSSSEISSSSNIGMDICLDFVPTRESKMLPFEYLLSESQERMLLLARREKYVVIHELFSKYNLTTSVIGVTNSSKQLRVFFEKKLYADIYVNYLCVNSEGAPRYRQKATPPKHVQNPKKIENITELHDLCVRKDEQAITIFLKNWLGDPNLSSRAPIYEQYDTDIGLGRIQGPGQNAGVYRVPGSNVRLAVTCDCNSFYVYQNPYKGAQHAVAESYRNLVSVGSQPIGITNCLNFGNPYNPENYFTFEQAIKGMSDAAEFLKVPITGGNVSLYNETKEGVVLPTPTIGMVGLIKNGEEVIPNYISQEVELYIVGYFRPTFDASFYSLYLERDHESQGVVPILNLEEEQKVAQFILENRILLNACIDVSLGGISMALSKMLFSRELRDYKVMLNVDRLFNDYQEQKKLYNTEIGELNNIDHFLFGETTATYVMAIDKTKEAIFLTQASQERLPVYKLGGIQNGEPEWNFHYQDHILKVNMQSLREAWEGGLKRKI